MAPIWTFAPGSSVKTVTHQIHSMLPKTTIITRNTADTSNPPCGTEEADHVPLERTAGPVHVHPFGNRGTTLWTPDRNIGRARLTVGWGLYKASTGLVSRRVKHTLPYLPYDYNELEPIVSAVIMLLHLKKHHQVSYSCQSRWYANLNYVNNLIVAEGKNYLSTVIRTHPALKFNGGGHINHSIF